MAYNATVEAFRDEEYPQMRGKIYLDHGGTTLYARSLVEDFSRNMIKNLYGNPHSNSDPAQLSSKVVHKARMDALAFVGADPEHFDLIFTANATAAIKLVGESFQDLAAAGSSSGTFFYGYHRDAHTSIVGIRELTGGTHHCFSGDQEVEDWLDGASATTNVPNNSGLPGLFAYPGQSNMTGRRLPLGWTRKLRQSTKPYHQNTYSLLDAAALATTAQLDLSDPDAAPDFTALSFYKIFGFPDLGALIVRKKSGHILSWRRYFGGGTVNMITVLHGPSVQRKDSTLHDALEDGTLPFHNIMALGCAIDVHKRLYGSMKNISLHTNFLIQRLYVGMLSLRHFNGLPVCVLHNDIDPDFPYEDATTQGSTIAFSVVQSDGSYIGHSVVEKLANEEGIFIRAGSLCNPGGISNYLKVEPWQFKRAWSAGHRCGEGHLEIINGLPTGVVRASLGAMSTLSDVDTFLEFLATTFESRGEIVQVVEHNGLESEVDLNRADSGFHSRPGSSTTSPHFPLIVKHMTSASNLKNSKSIVHVLHPQQSFYGRAGRHDMGRVIQQGGSDPGDITTAKPARREIFRNGHYGTEFGDFKQNQRYTIERQPLKSRESFPVNNRRYSIDSVNQQTHSRGGSRDETFSSEKKSKRGFRFWKGKKPDQ